MTIDGLFVNAKNSVEGIPRETNMHGRQSYFRDISPYPLLTPQQEKEIFAKYVGAKKEGRVLEAQTIAERIAEANLRFVVSIAKNYVNRFPLEMGISSGNVGLMKAIDHFDLSRNVRFISYAVWWIRQQITEDITEEKNMIHVPSNVSDARNKAEKIRRDALYLDKEVNEEKLSKIPSHKYIKHMPQAYDSLDTPVANSEEGSDRTLEDTIAGDADVFADVQTIEKYEYSRAMMGAALTVLPRREAKILMHRYGLNGKRPMTLQDTGKKFGLSRERIRQLEKRALRRVKKEFTGSSTAMEIISDLYDHSTRSNGNGTS